MPDNNSINVPEKPKIDEQATQEQKNIIAKARRKNQLDNNVHKAKVTFIWICL